MNQPKFEIVTTTTGVVSIRNNEVNEIMHNPVGPWIEANSLYIDQSNFAERLESTNELILFDVGLGAAANALAAIACFDKVRARPGFEKIRLRIVSFERDLELLQFALDNSSQFAHFKGYESTIAQILSHGHFERDGFSWALRTGDFVDLIASEKEKADVIFFDPYSPKVNNDMWTTSLFRKLRACAKNPEDNDFGASLYTYSQATRIRVALICAGFYVGYGWSTGIKNDTTEATTLKSSLKKPLGSDWHQTYLRSDSRYPFDCVSSDEASVDQKIADYFSESALSPR